MVKIVNSSIYKKGHSLPIQFIINTLKNMGCKNIKNIDYKRRCKPSLRLKKIIKERRNGIPDFICLHGGKETAVEVAILSHEKKVERLLNDFEKVIHIFSDDYLLLLHCILYEKKIKNHKPVNKRINGGN